jgi:hypothetical protein
LLDFDEGDGEGDAVGVGVTDGVAVAFGESEALGEALTFGDGLDFGVAEGVAPALGEGDGVGAAFFFVVELFRFFGGGVGSKICFILSPIDCASDDCGARTAHAKTAMNDSATATFRRAFFNEKAPSGSLCSAECRRRSFPAGSSR